MHRNHFFRWLDRELRATANWLNRQLESFSWNNFFLAWISLCTLVIIVCLSIIIDALAPCRLPGPFLLPPKGYTPRHIGEAQDFIVSPKINSHDTTDHHGPADGR